MKHQTVFILHHEYEQWGREDCKLIGIYATRDAADAAVTRLRDKPGFRDWPDCFVVDEYVLGEDHWTEGFSILVPIQFEITGERTIRWECVQAEWLSDDTYRIVDNEDVMLDEHPVLESGQIVRCEERTIDGNPGCLVAVECMPTERR